MSTIESTTKEYSRTEKRLRALLPIACVALFLLPALGHYLGGPLEVRVAGVELALFLGWISLIVVPVVCVIYVYTYEPDGDQA